VKGAEGGGRHGGADRVDDGQCVTGRVVQAFPEGDAGAVLGETGGPAANLVGIRG